MPPFEKVRSICPRVFWKRLVLQRLFFYLSLNRSGGFCSGWLHRVSGAGAAGAERQPPVVARAGTIPALFGALGPGLPVFEALLVFQVS